MSTHHPVSIEKGCCVLVAVFFGLLVAVPRYSFGFTLPGTIAKKRGYGRCIASSSASLYPCRGNNNEREALATAALFSSSSLYDNGGDNRGERRRKSIESFREERIRSALIENALALDGGAVAVGGDDNKDRSSGASSSSSLLTLYAVGQAQASISSGDSSSGSTIPSIVLSPSEQQQQQQGSSSSSSTIIPALVVPLENRGQLKLVAVAKANKKLSKSVLLGLNSLFVNRDGGLFDNLPWSEWSIDPQLRNRDAAGNPIDPRYHLGKRDAYNRFIGKDWQGRSLSAGNLALRLKYVLEEIQAAGNDDNDNEFFDEAEDGFLLAKRILEVQIREREMDLAGWDYEIAVARANNNNIDDDDNKDDRKKGGDALLRSLEKDRKACQLQLEETRTNLENLVQDKERGEGVDVLEFLKSFMDNVSNWSSSTATTTTTADEKKKKIQFVDEIKTNLEKLFDNNGKKKGGGFGPGPSKTGGIIGFLIAFLDSVARRSTNDGKNAAPYRGAMGYAPMLDTREDIEANSLLPYSSPYEFLAEVLEDQLNAEVIGTVLENTSLLRGYTVLGGAIILRRITGTTTATIAGETVSVKDENIDFGNENAGGGEIFVANCDADEAIGMGLACGVPLRVEQRDVWDRAAVSMTRQWNNNNNKERQASSSSLTEPLKGIWDYLPVWKTPENQEKLSFLVEGDRDDGAAATAPLQIPRTTTSLFDTTASSEKQRQSSSSLDRGLFPTDNPIRSLSEYDALANEDKARVLLSLSNFDARENTLPRPRELRTHELLATNNKSDNKNKNNNMGFDYESHPLDRLLLPLIDESVRREYKIREAERNGDRDLAETLKRSKSRYQIAKEKAAEAAEAAATATTGAEEEFGSGNSSGGGGDEGAEAGYWEERVGLYESLRADITQDEGSYSRFLDRDDWYQDIRQKQAKKIDKKKFGTLLDGIE